MFTLVAHGAPETFIFKESQLKFRFGAEYYYTNLNFDGSGQTFSLVNNKDYYQLNPFLGVRYDWANELSTYLNLNLSYSVSDDTLNKLTSFGLSTSQVGMDYSLGEWIFDHYLKLEGVIPLQPFNINSLVVPNSDGVWGVRAGDSFLMRAKNFTWINYLGAEYRGGGLASLFEFKTFFDWQFRKVNIGFGGSGFSSFTQDNDTSNAFLRRTYLNTVEQGSFKFDSVNPTGIQVDVMSGLSLGKSWDLNLDASQSVAGARYASGFTLMIYLNYKYNKQDKVWYKQKPVEEDENFQYTEPYEKQEDDGFIED